VKFETKNDLLKVEV